jgi:hypothetical protein
MTIEDPGPPYSDQLKPRDKNESDLSEAIEKAFKAKFDNADVDLRTMSELADSIQRSLDNEAGLIGDGYRVRFATSGYGAATVLRKNPAALDIVQKDGRILCTIVFNPQATEFRLNINTDVFRLPDGTTSTRHLEVPSLLQDLATTLVAKVSQIEYLERQGPVEARKFMPRVS